MALSSLTPTVDPSVARILTGTNSVTKSMSAADKNEAKIRQAAEGFERVLIRQMLSSARNTACTHPKARHRPCSNSSTTH